MAKEEAAAVAGDKAAAGDKPAGGNAAGGGMPAVLGEDGTFQAAALEEKTRVPLFAVAGAGAALGLFYDVRGFLLALVLLLGWYALKVRGDREKEAKAAAAAEAKAKAEAEAERRRRAAAEAEEEAARSRGLAEEEEAEAERKRREAEEAAAERKRQEEAAAAAAAAARALAEEEEAERKRKEEEEAERKRQEEEEAEKAAIAARALAEEEDRKRKEQEEAERAAAAARALAEEEEAERKRQEEEEAERKRKEEEEAERKRKEEEEAEKAALAARALAEEEEAERKRKEEEEAERKRKEEEEAERKRKEEEEAERKRQEEEEAERKRREEEEAAAAAAAAAAASSRSLPAEDAPKKKGHFRLTIVRGKDLVSRDSDGLSDPYVTAHLRRDASSSKSAKKAKTPVISDSLNPEWEYEAYDLPKFNPASYSTVDFEVSDYDGLLSRADFMGKACISVEELTAVSDGTPREIDLPLGAKKKEKDITGFITIRVSFEEAKKKKKAKQADGEETQRKVIGSEGTVSLARNESAALAPKDIVIGLGWEGESGSLGLGGLTEEKPPAMDATVLVFRHTTHIDDVYFHKPNFRDGAILHKGGYSGYTKYVMAADSDRSDVEQIELHLNQLSTRVNTILVAVTPGQGADFSQVKNAYIRIIDFSSHREITNFKIDTAAAKQHGFIVCKLFRTSPSSWHFTAMEEPCEGRVYKHMQAHVDPLLTTEPPERRLSVAFERFEVDTAGMAGADKLKSKMHLCAVAMVDQHVDSTENVKVAPKKDFSCSWPEPVVVSGHAIEMDLLIGSSSTASRLIEAGMGLGSRLSMDKLGVNALGHSIEAMAGQVGSRVCKATVPLDEAPMDATRTVEMEVLDQKFAGCVMRCTVHIKDLDF